MASPELNSSDLRASIDRDGFVLLPKLFSELHLTRFRAAAQNATKRARAGKWPYVRTVPKQFPPWPVDQVASHGIWGVQHLLHPSMLEEDRNVFAESYFCDIMTDAVTAILNCETEDLVMELYNMLVSPPSDFALRWHRDDIGPDVSPEEETARLKERMVHAQWNLALYPDSSLVVVPGSHRRSRTEMERHADPYEDDMPGQKVVKLEPGDVLFYNNNILHRGVYDSRTERMTLHGTMGTRGADAARARNILQHGLSWAAECEFGGLGEGMGRKAREMQRRLVEMGREQGRDVGFSQMD